MVPLKRYGNYPPDDASGADAARSRNHDDEEESDSDVPAGAQRGKEALLPLDVKLKFSLEENKASGNLNIIVEVREIRACPLTDVYPLRKVCLHAHGDIAPGIDDDDEKANPAGFQILPLRKCDAKHSLSVCKVVRFVTAALLAGS